MLDTLWDSGISLFNTRLWDTLEKAKRSLYYWRNVLFGELPLDSCLSLPPRGNREQLPVKEVRRFREPSRELGMYLPGFGGSRDDSSPTLEKSWRLNGKGCVVEQKNKSARDDRRRTVSFLKPGSALEPKGAGYTPPWKALSPWV